MQSMWTSGEMVAFVWGKRDLKTAQKLKKQLKRLGVTYHELATDAWDSFLVAFAEDTHIVGKAYTEGLKGITTAYGIEFGVR
jgi:IS1 family transposase